jgi:hypothetical protein
MLTRRHFLVSALGLGATGLAQGMQEGPKSDIGRRFMLWCKAMGLGRSIGYVTEVKEPFAYSLTVHVGHMIRVIGHAAAAELYERLYLKLLSMSELPPELVTLDIRSLQGDYCSNVEIATTITLTPDGLSKREKTVGPRAQYLCSIDIETVLRIESVTRAKHEAMRARAVPSVSTDSQKQTSARIFRRWLDSKYSARGANVVFTGVMDTWLSLVVTNVRGEVLTPAKYWERIQLFLFLEPLERITRIRLILDGKYGAGLNPPDERGYTDMEPDYTSSLLTYGKQLALQLTEVN